MTEFEKYSLLIDAVGAVVTLAAVVIAIWGERIRQIWTKPRLGISLHEPAFNITTSGKKGWYYLICVANGRPSSPAQNVRLLLTKVYKIGPDGLWQEQNFSGPTQVVWRWRDITPPYATIGPKQLSTFGCLRENSDFFELQLYWYPNNLKRAIPPNEPTRLEFKAVSDTAESKATTIEVAWDGRWVEGVTEMQNHCVVKEVKA
jgi:hypothetical protein